MKKELIGIGTVVLILALLLTLAPACGNDDEKSASTKTMIVVSDRTTIVMGGTEGGSYPHAAEYAWEPNLDDPNPQEPNNSFWDEQLDHAFSSGADWIWGNYRVVHPIEGDVVEFEKTFNVPGNPTAGTLYITCDNGYEVSVNGIYVGRGQLSDDWSSGDRTEDYVYASSHPDQDLPWGTVESYDIATLLVPGDNTLQVFGVNAYTGTSDDLYEGTIANNPAGLIFEIEIIYQ